MGVAVEVTEGVTDAVRLLLCDELGVIDAEEPKEREVVGDADSVVLKL